MLVVVWSQTYAQLPAKTENPSDTWEIRWSASDEFNGGSPDWAKWIRTGNLPNTSSWLWDNTNNVKVEDGIAELTMSHNAGNVPAQGTYFKSGILKSYNTFTYGYFEAKIKGSPLSGSGVCPSFWLFSNFDDSAPEGETIYSEIDVVELQQFDWYEGHQDDVRDMDLNLHAVVKRNGAREWRRPKQYPEEQLNKWRAPWDPRNDFHIYGCEVNENEIIWYVDGVEVGRKPNTYWNRPMNVTLSLGLRKPFVQFYDNRNNAINPLTDPEANALLAEMPTSMYVDYVRVWEKTGTSSNPQLPKGELGNPGFETGGLDYWGAGSGTNGVVSTGTQNGDYSATVSNASVAQIVTLEANTTYTVTAYGKVAAASTSAFMGVSKAITNELVENAEFTSTSYQQRSITFTTGATEESYRFWFWSAHDASCDNFTLSTGGTTTPPTDVPVTGIAVNAETLSLTAGETANISANVMPSNATNKQVTWASNNSGIASVNANGQVTAQSDGNATITVTTEEGGYTASVMISVTSANVGCGVAEWEAKAYSKGEQVMYNDTLYEVKWTSGIKNGGCVPGVCAGWTSLGGCSGARITDRNEPVIVNSVQVYPNPAEGYTTVNFGEHDGDKQVSLMNIQGVILKQWTVSTAKLEFSTQALHGVYLLQINYKQQSTVQKLVVK
ncbi:hypothetical protein BGP76_00100 [Reichenbachiella sp. MSK19-1]|nr:hypothetical protein BGP76_00100 [Reichenbachiella sp. MSK19-1]